MKKSLCLIAILVGIGSLTRGTYNPANLGNGWYTNLPPVTQDQLTPIIGCLVQGGAPVNPTLVAEPVFDWGDGRTVSPTELRWDIGGGIFHRSDAVLTYYGPQNAYVEIAKAQGRTPTREQYNSVANCAQAIKQPAVIVSVANPLGVKQAPDWCQEKLGVPDCWQGNRGDQFLAGGEFRDSTGLYHKYNGGFFVFGWSAWRRIG